MQIFEVKILCVLNEIHSLVFKCDRWLWKEINLDFGLSLNLTEQQKLLIMTDPSLMRNLGCKSLPKEEWFLCWEPQWQMFSLLPLPPHTRQVLYTIRAMWWFMVNFLLGTKFLKNVNMLPLIFLQNSKSKLYFFKSSLW